MGIFPNFRDENKKIFELPPPRNRQLMQLAYLANFFAYPPVMKIPEGERFIWMFPKIMVPPNHQF